MTLCFRMVIWAAFLCLAPEIWAQEILEGTISLNGGARVTNSSTVQVRVHLGSPAPEGLEMAISTDSAVGPWSPFLESQPVELPPGEGEKTVTVRLRDATGRKTAVLKSSILVDTVPPEAKVRVPEGVTSGTVTLISDVPDAVAMQWSEDASRWGPWVPYQQPRDIALSPGDGTKTVLVRYRDEAGNVSKPAVLRIQTKGNTAPSTSSAGQVQITAEPGPGNALAVILWISFPGMLEMSVQVDRDPALPREPVAAKKLLSISRTGGAHRVRLLFFDAAGAGHPVEIAFQEAEVQKTPGEPAQESPAPARGSLRLQGGVLPSGVHFLCVTPTGSRKIDSDPLGIARLSLSLEILDPFFGQVVAELTGGGAIEIASGGIDLGARIFRIGDVEIAAEAGFLYSHLYIADSMFGRFNSGIGFHGGVRASVGLEGGISLDAMVDYRWISYDYSGTIVSGDRQARLRKIGLLLGASLRF